tara:strand:+ start:124 stop:546 length:423 start_codon:yes stop_codon:yes gene_type:complete
MKLFVQLLILFGAYKLYQAAKGGTSLDIDFTGLGIEGGIDNFIVILKAKVYNPGNKLTLNSIQAEILMNDEKIGFVNYHGNNILLKGYTNIKIPVVLDTSDATKIIDAILSLQIFKLTVEGEVTINNIPLPYTNNIISNA